MVRYRAPTHFPPPPPGTTSRRRDNAAAQFLNSRPSFDLLPVFAIVLGCPGSFFGVFVDAAPPISLLLHRDSSAAIDDPAAFYGVLSLGPVFCGFCECVGFPRTPPSLLST